jgi:hypothetical protein
MSARRARPTTDVSGTRRVPSADGPVPGQELRHTACACYETAIIAAFTRVLDDEPILMRGLILRSWTNRLADDAPNGFGHQLMPATRQVNRIDRRTL